MDIVRDNGFSKNIYPISLKLHSSISILGVLGIEGISTKHSTWPPFHAFYFILKMGCILLNDALDWELSSYAPQANSGSQLQVFSKVLLEHMQPCKFVYILWLHQGRLVARW